MATKLISGPVKAAKVSNLLELRSATNVSLETETRSWVMADIKPIPLVGSLAKD